MVTEHDLIPPWTQLPNILMDYVIPLMRESEEKVLLYVLRRTYGFKDAEGRRKEQDTISFSQFLGGQVSREGTPLDFGCGISRSKLVEALAFLNEIDLVQRVDAAAGKAHAGRGATGQYHLNLHSGIVQKVNQYLKDPETARERMVQYLNQSRLIVQKLNQLRNESRKLKKLEPNGSESEPLNNGSESEPEMVQKVNQQKKEKETEAKDTPPISPSPASADEVTNIDTNPAKFVNWWNRDIVPLGGRPFSLEDADAKFIAKANLAIKAKSSRGFWERVKQGFEASSFLRGEIMPSGGKKRFKATLPWLLSLHYQKKITNYTLVVQNEWADDPEETHDRKPISHDEVEL